LTLIAKSVLVVLESEIVWRTGSLKLGCALFFDSWDAHFSWA